MKDSDFIIYLAGLIDGEGCIYVDKNRLCHNTCLSIHMTYAPILKEIYRRYGGSFVEYKIVAPRKRSWRWRLCGKRAVALLRKCYPYLYVKRIQAKLLFELYSGVQSNGKKLPLTEIERRKKIYIQLRELKKEYTDEKCQRGRGPG